jgi:hypothetical protein
LIVLGFRNLAFVFSGRDEEEERALGVFTFPFSLACCRVLFFVVFFMGWGGRGSFSLQRSNSMEAASMGSVK